MPYRFSSTTGNIVRPIESLCLNASTGAIITPLRYGPAGTAITMWNGVIEQYSTLARYKPATYIGDFSSPTYAYDYTSTWGDTATAAVGTTTATSGRLTKVMKTCIYTGFPSVAMSSYTSAVLKLIQKYAVYAANDAGWGKEDGYIDVRYAMNGTDYGPLYALEPGAVKTDTAIQSYALSFTSAHNLANLKLSFVVQAAIHYDALDQIYVDGNTIFQLYDIWIELT